MPTITSGKVLVTGANGYIAIWLVKKLLESGYSVRGTVRTEAKGVYLKTKFEEYGDKFEIVIVEDIAKDGAFDEAVKGVDAVEHTASPVTLEVDDPNDVIIPAVKGTIGILDSILKNGPSIKRVVITSSCAAVNPGLTDTTKTTVLSEKDWNTFSEEEVKSKGKAAASLHKYRTSKVLAERAAWKFVEEHKSQISWDLVIINPPFVFGPPIQQITKPQDLNASIAHIYKILQQVEKGESLSPEVLTSSAGNWVDVRDVAEAHVRALFLEGASGRRFIVSAGAFTYQDILNTLSTTPTTTSKNPHHPVIYDNSASRTVLGLEFRSMEVCFGDMVGALRALGL